MRNHMPTCRCTGISLVELMLGLTIGLGVLLAAGMLYQAQRQSWALMQAMHALHHNANAAFDHMQTSVQSAHAVILESTPLGNVMLGTLPAHDWGMTEGNTRSDGLALSHFSALDRDDCQGNHAESQTHIRDSYQINGKLELTCKDTLRTGSTYQAIAEGVEDFQLRFAERLPSPTSGSAPSWQWKNADQINVNTQVRAIEICLRMVSTQATDERVSVPARLVLGCQGEAVPDDGKLRRVFHRVLTLRSREAANTL